MNDVEKMNETKARLENELDDCRSIAEDLEVRLRLERARIVGLEAELANLNEPSQSEMDKEEGAWLDKRR